jgi:hypothetical protein
MELTARRIEKLESACAALLELMTQVPSSPLPLRAFVGTAAKWEDAANDGRLRALASQT